MPKCRAGVHEILPAIRRRGGARLRRPAARLRGSADARGDRRHPRRDVSVHGPYRRAWQPPEPVVFEVAVTVAQDEVFVDWAGSSRQVAGGINCTFTFTKSCVYAAIRSVFRRDVDCAASPDQSVSEPFLSGIDGQVVNATLKWNDPTIEEVLGSDAYLPAKVVNHKRAAIRLHLKRCLVELCRVTPRQISILKRQFTTNDDERSVNQHPASIVFGGVPRPGAMR